MELVMSEAVKSKLAEWPRIVPARPVTPSDEIIDERIKWNRSISRAFVYGPDRTPTIYLTDKRGNVQETVTVGPQQKTMGFQQFMQTYADHEEGRDRKEKAPPE